MIDATRIDLLDRAGERAHARWDGGAFRAVAEARGAAVAKALVGRADAAAALDAYLTLVREAVGQGWLSARDLDAPGGSPRFLARALVELVPARIMEVADGDAVRALARLWNAGERLIDEPAWLERYLAACCDGTRSLARFEEWLAAALAPVLEPARLSEWRGPFTESRLDARERARDFVPGEVHLAAPSVACVHDRQASGQHLALVLEAGGRSRVVAVAPCLGRATDGAAPHELAGGTVRVGTSQVSLSGVVHAHSVLATRSGFLVASVVDSQRVWVVESP